MEQSENASQRKCQRSCILKNECKLIKARGGKCKDKHYGQGEQKMQRAEGKI